MIGGCERAGVLDGYPEPMAGEFGFRAQRREGGVR